MGSSIVCVGPLGYDDVETPSGTFRRRLGGSAFHFATVAALFAPTRIVAAVGDDFDQQDLELLAGQGVDMGGVVRLAGRTHHWAARYSPDLSRAATLVNDLGVMDEWDPVVPDQAAGDLLYLGSMRPRVQARLSRAAAPGVVTVFDTQSHWIDADRAAALEAAAGCAISCLNEREVLALTGASGAAAGAAELIERGNEAVFVKAGAHGASLFHRAGTAHCAAVPAERVEDPTGAGDSFAGGVVGQLARRGGRGPAALSEALVYGVACGSLAVERPAGQRIAAWSPERIEERARLLRPAAAL